MSINSSDSITFFTAHLPLISYFAMASFELYRRELKIRAFEEDLYMNVKFPVISSVQQLINQSLGMNLSPLLDATLRVFLEFVKELEELFRQKAVIDREIFAAEMELEFREEEPEKKKREFREELVRLGVQKLRLEQELAQMCQRCNAMRENPPF